MLADQWCAGANTVLDTILGFRGDSVSKKDIKRYKELLNQQLSGDIHGKIVSVKL